MCSPKMPSRFRKDFARFPGRCLGEVEVVWLHGHQAEFFLLERERNRRYLVFVSHAPIANHRQSLMNAYYMICMIVHVYIYI